VWFVNRIIAIRKNKCFSRDEALEILGAINPKDEEFIEAARRFETKRKALARHILHRIHQTHQAGLGDLRTGKTHNIEHILPQNPTGDWTKNFGDDAEDHVNRLSNLVLLETALNKEAGRKPFAEKKLIYAKSAISENSSLSKLKNWTPKELDNRGIRLAERMLSIWQAKSAPTTKK